MTGPGDDPRVEVFQVDEGPNAGRWLARFADFETLCDSHPQAVAAADVIVRLEQSRRAEQALRAHATAYGYVGPAISRIRPEVSP